MTGKGIEKRSGKSSDSQGKIQAQEGQPENTEEIAYQNKDITSKVLAEAFKGKTFRVYGLDLPEVRAVQPTNLPVVKANELRLDNLFELMDDTVAIVDYESVYRKEDKVKYLNYLTGIANRYQKEKKDCPVLRMIVIYTGDITREQVSEEYNIGAVRMTLELAFLSELDSERIFLHLQQIETVSVCPSTRNHLWTHHLAAGNGSPMPGYWADRYGTGIENKELLDDEELMKFIILPLSYRNRTEIEAQIRKCVKLAAKIHDREQQIFVLSGILAFTDKLIDMEAADRIRKEIEMTKVGRLYEEEKRQELARVEEEKQQELAKVGQALARAEAEKQKAEAEKQKAEAEKQKAEAEKQKAEEEKRNIVAGMLKRNYPTEEILSLVTGFSVKDIESMRKEACSLP